MLSSYPIRPDSRVASGWGAGKVDVWVSHRGIATTSLIGSDFLGVSDLRNVCRFELFDLAYSYINERAASFNMPIHYSKSLNLYFRYSQDATFQLPIHILHTRFAFGYRSCPRGHFRMHSPRSISVRSSYVRYSMLKSDVSISSHKK